MDFEVGDCTTQFDISYTFCMELNGSGPIAQQKKGRGPSLNIPEAKACIGLSILTSKTHGF